LVTKRVHDIRARVGIGQMKTIGTGSQCDAWDLHRGVERQIGELVIRDATRDRGGHHGKPRHCGHAGDEESGHEFLPLLLLETLSTESGDTRWCPSPSETGLSFEGRCISSACDAEAVSPARARSKTV